MWKKRLLALFVLVLGALVAYGAFSDSEKKPFRLGLDLSGGVLLTYNADITDVPMADVDDRLESLRDVIERRVNSDVSGALGVLEPTIRVEKSTFLRDKNSARLLVELPGVTDTAEAINVIGETPLLEFRTENPDFDLEKVEINEETGQVSTGQDAEPYILTELNGQYLKSARVEFTQGAQAGVGGAVVAITFDKEGADIFEILTEENIDRTLAIYLDGVIISAPTVNEKISGGEAVISGNFTPEEAKELASRLALGALPVEIELVATQEIGPTLGHTTVDKGVAAAIIGFLVVAIFFILWYRVPGFVAVVSLTIYGAIMLGLFRLIPVTITAAGIAGFVLSIGIAVDANILIFERLKEELKKGKNLADAMQEGFKRAWVPIRDSNVSSILSAFILFLLAPSLVRGFALTFGLGVVVSMFSAITVTRIFLLSLALKDSKINRALLASGFSSGVSKNLNSNLPK